MDSYIGRLSFEFRNFNFSNKIIIYEKKKKNSHSGLDSLCIGISSLILYIHIFTINVKINIISNFQLNLKIYIFILCIVSNKFMVYRILYYILFM